MSKQMKGPQNNQSPKLQGRHLFRQQLQYELKRIPFLLPYMISVFGWIVQHPKIHLLAEPTLMMLVVIALWTMLEYLIRVWTHGPSEPPVIFHWWKKIGEDLLIFIFPYVFLALLMWLNHYPW